MKITFATTLYLLLTVLTACNGPSKEAADTKQSPLYEEVMAIHDDVMPKNADILRVARELKGARKDLSDSTLIKQVEIMVERLEDADEAMMNWMRSFKLPKDESQQPSYLEDQKEKISQVRDQMLSALNEGTALKESLNDTNN